MTSTRLTRREMLALTAGGAIAAQAAPSAADITLRIANAKVELGPRHVINTLTYNGQVPGPLLRMKEGKQVAVEVINETKQPEMVHWHGFHIPPEVDGAHEEGTPMVQALDRRTYTFTPQPSGTRWYHTHAMAGHDLRVGLYSGQFGMVIVEPKETRPAMTWTFPSSSTNSNRRSRLVMRWTSATTFFPSTEKCWERALRSK